MTIFTNNTITSTLSPKSNLSLTTFKSSSKPKTSKQGAGIAQTNATHGPHATTQNSTNKKSLLQFQVGSNVINKIKKMDEKDRQTCIPPQALNGPIKSRIASKITAKIRPKKGSNPHSGSNRLSKFNYTELKIGFSIKNKLFIKFFLITNINFIMYIIKMLFLI